MPYDTYGNQREDDQEQLELQQQLGGFQPLADDAPPTPGGAVSLKPGAGQNSGVAGGVDRGGPAAGGPDEAAPRVSAPSSRAAAVKKAQAEGYTDIEGAGGLKTGNYMGGLEGFNTGAWGSDERGSNTLKNSFGKIASRYDPTQPGAAKALMADPDFAEMFPDAYIVEHPNQDLIDFDGPGGDPPVDVLRGATEGGAGAAWQWGVQDGGAGGGGADAALAGLGGGDGGGTATSVDGLMNSDILAQIRAELDKLAQGGQSGGDEQALVQSLLTGAR